MGTSKLKPTVPSTSVHLSGGAKLKASGQKKEKERLKGVIVKKKSNAPKNKVVTEEGANVSDNSRGADKLGEREAKRRKTDDREKQGS